MCKEIDIKEDVINKRTGVHHIRLQDKKLLDSRLNELHDKDLFDKYNMSYVYTVNHDNITLIIHKAFNYMIH